MAETTKDNMEESEIQNLKKKLAKVEREYKTTQENCEFQRTNMPGQLEELE